MRMGGGGLTKKEKGVEIKFYPHKKGRSEMSKGGGEQKSVLMWGFSF